VFREVAERTASGRLFYTRAAASPSARSPMVRSRVRGMISLWVVDDRRHCRELLSAVQCRSLARYSTLTGVVSLRQQKTSTATASRNLMRSGTLSRRTSVFRISTLRLHWAQTGAGQVLKHVRGNTTQVWRCRSPVVTVPATTRATAGLACWLNVGRCGFVVVPQSSWRLSSRRGSSRTHLRPRRCPALGRSVQASLRQTRQEVVDLDEQRRNREPRFWRRLVEVDWIASTHWQHQCTLLLGPGEQQLDLKDRNGRSECHRRIGDGSGLCSARTRTKRIQNGGEKFCCLYRVAKLWDKKTGVIQKPIWWET